MLKHKTGTREEWLAARLKLLEDEKALTRRSDELADATGPALGTSRQEISLRDRRGRGDACGFLRRALAAARLSLHVRP
jgi:hypothetical protein